MLDYSRPPDTCDMYYPPPPAPARLDDFQVFRKGTPHAYADYYDCDYAPTDAAVYHDLLAFNHRDDWTRRFVADWSADDVAGWIAHTVHALGASEYEVPFHNFRVSGVELRSMRREEWQQRMLQPGVDAGCSRRLADTLLERLQRRLEEELLLPYERDPYQPEPQTVLDLDAPELRRTYEYRPPEPLRPDSGDDDEFRLSESASPEGSDASKSGDEDDKRRMFKRPPGRPKGSGRKMSAKRPRSVSVPEFLRNLLMDPRYCPAIIKWEDYSQGKFRFVKPDDVAKLWGKLKQNDNMTFEKFSRAMRYHYRQAVLVSVPTARLVYQFGHKGPDFHTDNPNFVKVKPEL